MIEIRHDYPEVPDALKVDSGALTFVDRKSMFPDRDKLTSNGGSDLQRLVQEQWIEHTPIFRILSIETQTGCNISCSFCPVAKNRDPRPNTVMSLKLIESIAQQLSSINYRGKINLFCNNEPLLDTRIPEIIAIFRLHCANANIKILTNGVLLNIDLIHELFLSGLSVLEIDNYTDGRKLIMPVAELISHHRELAKYDIRINLRKRVETLTNRAGSAPNMPALISPLKQFCALPFVDLNITASGRVSLCCFDAVDQHPVGDANIEPILAIWKGFRFKEARNRLLKIDRSQTNICAVCDYDGYRTPQIPPNFID